MLEVTVTGLEITEPMTNYLIGVYIPAITIIAVLMIWQLVRHIITSVF